MRRLEYLPEPPRQSPVQLLHPRELLYDGFPLRPVGKPLGQYFPRYADARKRRAMHDHPAETARLGTRRRRPEKRADGARLLFDSDPQALDGLRQHPPRRHLRRTPAEGATRIPPGILHAVLPPLVPALPPDGQSVAIDEAHESPRTRAQLHEQRRAQPARADDKPGGRRLLEQPPARVSAAK